MAAVITSVIFDVSEVIGIHVFLIERLTLALACTAFSTASTMIVDQQDIVWLDVFVDYFYHLMAVVQRF